MVNKCSVLKKISIFILCVFMITLYMFVIGAEASAYSGTCGDNLTWELDTDTGVLTISGTGDMTVYNASQAPWYSYKSDIASVVIESGVSSITAYAFYYCENLTNIDISDSASSIKTSAFTSCYSLTNINVSNNSTYESYDGVLYKNDFTDLIYCPQGGNRRNCAKQYCKHKLFRFSELFKTDEC